MCHLPAARVVPSFQVANATADERSAPKISTTTTPLSTGRPGQTASTFLPYLFCSTQLAIDRCKVCSLYNALTISIPTQNKILIDKIHGVKPGITYRPSFTGDILYYWHALTG